MAIWQYDFLVAPRDDIAAIGMATPSVFTSDQLNIIKCWKTSQPHPDFDVEFGKWRPELEPWSPDFRSWGEEESNRIDVTVKNGQVSYIVFRVELRSLNARFIELLASFARKNNCLLISLHSLVAVEPFRQSIITYLCRSPGANKVLDWLLNPTLGINMPSYPQVFLSHSSADKPFVSKLAIDLKSRGIPVWFDQWELKVGDSLTQKIEDGIDKSGWLIVVLSENSIASNWVQKELRAAQARELQDKHVFVLPVVIDKCRIPTFLLDKLYADFTLSYERGLNHLLGRLMDGEYIR
ncbi:toll/interleukin-1 receptor domain-containing protein [Massilia pinisoli]|uniref:Toll/interleukin-1 receptor domain-containing protein n=1 Tax=Massilia pinisoli TaxID=1772194 RepID=A0ABT1ZZ41_9BURK|nr:toll/interleukin-1 receptor domain-containing protein [Massilia pinisoli]MCS0585185.1 toll/interleukin-1 receptor domain-containing protein [Massilia pinisoli]